MSYQAEKTPTIRPDGGIVFADSPQFTAIPASQGWDKVWNDQRIQTDNLFTEEYQRVTDRDANLRYQEVRRHEREDQARVSQEPLKWGFEYLPTKWEQPQEQASKRECTYNSTIPQKQPEKDTALFDLVLAKTNIPPIIAYGMKSNLRADIVPNTEGLSEEYKTKLDGIVKTVLVEAKSVLYCWDYIPDGVKQKTDDMVRVLRYMSSRPEDITGLINYHDKLVKKERHASGLCIELPRMSGVPVEGEIKTKKHLPNPEVIVRERVDLSHGEPHLNFDYIVTSKESGRDVDFTKVGKGKEKFLTMLPEHHQIPLKGFNEEDIVESTKSQKPDQLVFSPEIIYEIDDKEKSIYKFQNGE